MLKKYIDLFYFTFRKSNSFTLPNIANHQNHQDNENDSLDENKTKTQTQNTSNHGGNRPVSDTKLRSSRNKQQQKAVSTFSYYAGYFLLGTILLNFKHTPLFK